MTKPLFGALRGALSLAFLAASLALVAQTVTVSGSVVDASTSEPIIGANVLVEGTGTGTVTDYDGQFQLQVETGSTLEIRYVGYKEQRLPIGDADQAFEILLEEDAAELEQVVVVGYGSQRKSDLTGAISSISEEEIKSLPVTGLDQALQGRAAGVYVTQNSGAPGGGVSVQIRGIGSVNGAEPLYVVDGVPIGGDASGGGVLGVNGGGQPENILNTINPNDIKSVEILKDASATAIYGSRGANGVVLITTIRGQSGTSDISYETFYQVSEIANRIEVMDLRQYAEYLLDRNPAQAPREFRFPELLGEGTDWQDAVFQRGSTQNHQLSISAGNEKTQFSLSGGFNQQEGTIIGSSFDRYSGRFTVDHDLASKVKIGASLLLGRTNERIAFADNDLGVLNTALRLPPSVAVRNADGTYAGPDPALNLNFQNPVANALQNNNTRQKTRVLSNLYFQVDLTPWLQYRTELGTNIQFDKARLFRPSVDEGLFQQNSSLQIQRNEGNFWINKHLLTFNETFADRHRITALAGFEAQANAYEYLGTSRNDLANNFQQELNLGDAGSAQNFGGTGESSLTSWFARVNYVFNEKYLITATGRIDGSSRFGPNNKYGYFPSASVAWRISQEDWMDQFTWIDNLKLRVGYGGTGNQEIGDNTFRARVNATNAVIGGQQVTGFVPQNISNPDVRWESSQQFNVGADIGFIDNRIALTADAYLKRSDGMLLPAILPASVGSFESPFVNTGQIDNYGVELTINTVNTTGKVGWNTSFNFSANRNEVVSLGSTGALIGQVQTRPVTRTVVGQPVSQFYGFVVEGIFQSQQEIFGDEDAGIPPAPRQTGNAQSPNAQTVPGDVRFADLNGDQVIDDEDQTFIGNPIPDFTANMNNTVTYGGFELTAFVQGVFGNQVLSLLNRQATQFFGTANQIAANAVNRFTTDNPSAIYPRATGDDFNRNTRISDRYVEDASFIRLRTVNLAYRIPTAAAEQIRLSNARVYVSAQNLFTITDYSGYDPEVGSFAQDPLLNGIDNGRYPTSRAVTVGLSANF